MASHVRAGPRWIGVGRRACAAAAALLAAALVSLALVAAAGADSRLIVGVDDDGMKWTASPGRIVHAYGDLRLGALRVTLQWQPGERRLDSLSALYLRRVTSGIPRSMRVVLGVYGNPNSAPITRWARDQYCAFVGDALRQAPAIHDVVIWNEVNSKRFWRPQRRAAVGYEALLSKCYDRLHSIDRRVNVISSTSPHADPGSFISALGAAYRASGRHKRIFDTFGHNAYPDTNSESPLALHLGSKSMDEGDYLTLLATLRSAFAGTAQPVPGQANVRIWYLEDGFETAVPRRKRGAYTGREVAASVVDASPGPSRESGSVRDQAAQLREAIDLAYCQPAVGAFFNFELVDDSRLTGWQSGVLWADWTRKPSYSTLKSAIQRVRSRKVDCTRFPASVR
jgi:hypothetical protein